MKKTAREQFKEILLQHFGTEWPQDMTQANCAIGSILERWQSALDALEAATIIKVSHNADGVYNVRLAGFTGGGGGGGLIMTGVIGTGACGQDASKLVTQPFATEGVELAVGQVWRTRSDDKVKIVEFDEKNTIYPFMGNNQFSYTSKGLRFQGEESGDDLVEHVPALAVGQVWRTRGGERVEIIKFEDDCAPYPFVGSNGASYTLTGTEFTTMRSDADLVERVA